MTTIVKISTNDMWNEAEKAGVLLHPSLVEEGFIHCSTIEQVTAVANRLYKGHKELLLLVIDPDKLEAELKYEPAKNGQLYPHIYGPLNLNAVIKKVPFLADNKGEFSLPLEISNL
ncbi:DUF952 domain-containing protein [Brevibacillus daliensis]|uniref:DUF952 domain-containing protein n=1 Tax=Brevibacillus daliensis TaxID=2892995 RepID=UPI001E5480FF|nr:DUF952 domain-containing protein [Brevibacillus daliensis]